MKIGIIGAGYMSTVHAAAFAEVGAEIRAVHDVREESFTEHKGCFGSAVFCKTAEELLADPLVDAVDICVTNKHHAEMVRKAAAAGKHIFCEKTLTDSEADSRELVDLLNGYRPNFQIGYMKRFFPATVKAIELVPEIGEIISAYIRSYQGFEHDDDIYNMDGWKPTSEGPSSIHEFTPGGMLNMAGSHMLDLMNLFLGMPRTAYSVSWTPKAYDVITNSHALFTMPNGGAVHFEACLSPYSREGAFGNGWDERVEINGRLGRIEIAYPIWNKPMNNAPVLTHYSETTKTRTQYTFPCMNPFIAEMAEFVKNCESGNKSLPGVAEGYAVDKLIFRCLESAKTGRVLSM